MVARAVDIPYRVFKGIQQKSIPKPGPCQGFSFTSQAVKITGINKSSLDNMITPVLSRAGCASEIIALTQHVNGKNALSGGADTASAKYRGARVGDIYKVCQRKQSQARWM